MLDLDFAIVDFLKLILPLLPLMSSIVFSPILLSQCIFSNSYHPPPQLFNQVEIHPNTLANLQNHSL